jgi:triphosphatase
LKEMQDCLGELNDIFVHENLTTSLVGTSAAAKLLTGQEAARFEPAMTAATQAFRKFEKLDPYWN